MLAEVHQELHRRCDRAWDPLFSDLGHRSWSDPLGKSALYADKRAITPAAATVATMRIRAMRVWSVFMDVLLGVEGWTHRDRPRMGGARVVGRGVSSARPAESSGGRSGSSKSKAVGGLEITSGAAAIQ